MFDRFITMHKMTTRDELTRLIEERQNEQYFQDTVEKQLLSGKEFMIRSAVGKAMIYVRIRESNVSAYTWLRTRGFTSESDCYVVFGD